MKIQLPKLFTPDSTPQKKVAVVVTSDHHINAYEGLCPPAVGLTGGGTYLPSPCQVEIWEAWLDFWKWVDSKTKGFERVGIFNGDLAEYDPKNRRTTVITRNENDILRATLKALAPGLDLLDRFYIMMGTPSHTGPDAWVEQHIGEMLKDKAVPGGTQALPDGTTDQEYFHRHLRAIAAGVRFDVCHAIRTTSVTRNRQGISSRLAADAITDYHLLKLPPPHVMIRSHCHIFDMGFLGDVHAFTSPSWAGKSTYPYKSGYENVVPQIGGLLFLCEAGEYTWDKKIYEIESLKKVETV